MTKLKYCYSHLKSFVFMFWIVSFMFLNHLSIPYTPNPLFHPISFFSSRMQSPNLFQILHCFIHHKPRQFRPSLSPFFFDFFFTRPAILHPERCATPLILLFQQRNAHSHTSFFNSSHIRFSLICLNATQRWTFSLFIHPSSHRCSTSSRNEIIPLFSDSIHISKSTDQSVRRDASIAMNRCLHRFYQEMICISPDGLWTCLITFASRFSSSNRSFGHLWCAKNGRNLHIHQLHFLESIYSSCISHTRIRKILWW